MWKYEKINLGQRGANFIARPQAQICLATPLCIRQVLRNILDNPLPESTLV